MYASDPTIAQESPFSSVQEAALADAPNFSQAPVITTKYGTDAGGKSYVEVEAVHTFSSVSKFPGLLPQMNIVRSVRMYVAAKTPDVN